MLLGGIISDFGVERYTRERREMAFIKRTLLKQIMGKDDALAVINFAGISAGSWTHNSFSSMKYAFGMLNWFIGLLNCLEK